MNAAERLTEIVSALDRLEIPYLVTGGHAARYYGIERNTIDYDLHITFDDWSRRPAAFRRFLIGRLSDGREEAGVLA